MEQNPQRILSFKIIQAKLGLLWEQLWQASFWPTMITGIGLLVVFSGLLALLPVYLRLGILVLAVLALLYSCRPLFRLRWPSQKQALRRIETKSHLSHRPVTAWHDNLADSGVDAQSQAIWKLHKKRQQEQFSALKTGVPRSNWMYLDPWAGRFTLAILLLVTLVLNGQNWRFELSRLAGESTLKTVQQITLDAWISPPTYTRKPPLLLTSEAFKKTLEKGEGLVVPEGSKLKIRINGVSNFSVVLSKQLENGEPGEELETVSAKPENETGFSEATVILKRPVHVAIKYQDNIHASWKIALIPDDAPVVEITAKLSITPTGGFAVPWKVSDDYGVSVLGGTITLIKRTGKAVVRGLKYDPPIFSASLPRLNPKQAKGRAFQDLTAHPWAGRQVELVMSATDQAGKIGLSRKVAFKLPERDFRKPLARVLVEQRRKLVENPDNKRKIVKSMAAFMAWPEGILKKSGTYLGWRKVVKGLYRAKSDDQIKASVAEMWKLALAIEDGDLSEARRKLEAARRALQKALKDGASPAEIAKLTKNLKDALNKYMQAMARQMQQAQANKKAQQNGLQQNGRQIRGRDLQKMMDQIENLAKSGANDAAQEMLSQLENILKNLQPSLAQNPMAPQRTPPEAKSLEELTKMMRKQQELIDKTFKMPEQKFGRKVQDKKQNRKSGNKKQGANFGKELTTQQDQLKSMLGKLMEQMEKNGLPAPRSLEQAKRAMRDASRALKNGQKGPALGMQGNAMQGLRKGAETMAKDMMQRGQGDDGNFGKHNETAGNQNDPLGRPMPRDGAEFGPNKDMLPKESEIMRARDIMRALRSRSNDRRRPKVELDYLQRLLDGLF